MGNLDFLADERGLSKEDIRSRSKTIVYLWSLLRIKYSQFFQRSKAKWLKEGNTNIDFFMVLLKIKVQKELAYPLKVGEDWI